MKIRCESCGHTIELDEAYSNYEGSIKCYTCSALMEIKLKEGSVISAESLELAHSAPKKD